MAWNDTKWPDFLIHIGTPDTNRMRSVSLPFWRTYLGFLPGLDIKAVLSLQTADVLRSPSQSVLGTMPEMPEDLG
jgi:hypothetical protein